jgi:hypothetical protein
MFQDILTDRLHLRYLQLDDSRKMFACLENNCSVTKPL